MATCSSMTPRTRPTLILFGDSMTQYGYISGSEPGWVGLLSHAYQRRADVLNRGYSGYNTRHAIHVLPTAFGAYNGEGEGEIPSALERTGRPLMVAVFFGANDAALPGEGLFGNQHVPLDEYEKNLKAIVSRIRKRMEGVKNEGNDVPILLITPPPVEQNAWDDYCQKLFNGLSPRTNSAAKQYGEKVKSVAEEMGCSVVDCFTLLGGHDVDETTYGKNLADGLHLNGAGNKLLFEGFMKVVNKEFPELAPMEMEGGKAKQGSSGISEEGPGFFEIITKITGPQL